MVPLDADTPKNGEIFVARFFNQIRPKSKVITLQSKDAGNSAIFRLVSSISLQKVIKYIDTQEVYKFLGNPGH